MGQHGRMVRSSLDSPSESPVAAHKERGAVLDPVERVSEMCFGLFMALTFVGAVRAATAGEDVGRTMLYTALGCNLAWGLVDAVMYLVRTISERGKRLTLALHVRAAPDSAAATKVLHEELPPLLRQLLTEAEIEALRARLMTATLPERPRLTRGDFAGALGIFIIVVLSTFPVALPFVVLGDVSPALVVLRPLTVAVPFAGGAASAPQAGVGGGK